MKNLMILFAFVIGTAISLPASASSDNSPPVSISVLDYDAPAFESISVYTIEAPASDVIEYSILREGNYISRQESYISRAESPYLFTYDFSKDYRAKTKGSYNCRTFDC
jgi:hypothetical protein